MFFRFGISKTPVTAVIVSVNLDLVNFFQSYPIHWIAKECLAFNRPPKKSSCMLMQTLHDKRHLRSIVEPDREDSKES